MRIETLKSYEGKKVEVVLINGFTYSGILKRVDDISTDGLRLDKAVVNLVDVKKGLVDIDAESILVVYKTGGVFDNGD